MLRKDFFLKKPQIIGGINCASSAAKEIYGKITALGDQIAGHVKQISDGAQEVFEGVRHFLEDFGRSAGGVRRCKAF
jgi:hypothetical protein